MDNPKPLYCTVQDHIYMARYGLDTCPKCGGSTQEDIKSQIEVNYQYWQKHGISTVSLNPITGKLRL